MSGEPRASPVVVVAPELTKIGAWVSTKQDGRLLNGTVMYFGPIKNKPGEWVGLDLDDECGKNDGSVGEDRYFYCPPKHGLFLHPSALLVAPELTKIGARVSTKQDGRLLNGTVMYFGPIKNKPGEWAGLGLDQACGKNDGSVGEDRYFSCSRGHGLFVRSAALLKLIAPFDDSAELVSFSDSSEFIRTMRSTRNDKIYSQIRLDLESAALVHERDPSTNLNLVDAIRFCKRNHEFRFMVAGSNLPIESVFTVLVACAENCRFVGLATDQSYNTAVLQALPKWRHLKELALSFDNFGTSFHEKDLVPLAKALMQVHDLKVFTPPNVEASQVSASTIEALVELRLQFPRVRLNTGWQQGLLDCRVAIKAIKNKTAEDAVVSRQLDLLRSYTSGDLGRTKRIFRDLKHEIAQPEENRLLHLLSLLHEKYCIIGGYEFLQIPPDFDLYKGVGAFGQHIPDPLLSMSQEVQVRYVLAVAHFKAGILTELCDQVEVSLAQLGLCIHADRAEECLESFLKKEGLSHVASQRMVLELASGGKQFKQEGYYNGMPAFREKSGLHLFRHPLSCWLITKELGSSSCSACLKDEREDQARLLPLIEACDNQKWLFGGVSEDGLRIADSEAYPLKDALLKFLQRRAEDPSLGRLASLRESLYELKVGPMKGLARAQQKQAKELRDVNRCTFVADSPLVLAVIFHLVDQKTRAMGGEISRLNNYFFKDGRLNMEMKQPPCIHLNLRIPKDARTGWTFEVMLTLSDFAEAKEVLHKYYEITRCSSPLDLMMPIFKPFPLDPTKTPTE